jgi:hypothetical protein
MTTDDGRRSRVAGLLVVAGWVVAGVMMLSTSTVRWVSSGPGSRFGGLELADNLRTGALSSDWGSWVALAFYSIVGIGGLLIATAVIERTTVVVARCFVCVAGLVAFVVMGWGVLPIDNLATGPTIATMSFILSTALSAFQLVTSTRT